MIFVDTNVFMYAVGRPHTLQTPAQTFFVEANRRDMPLCTSAEVMQELAHVYLPTGRLQTFDATLALMANAAVEVWPLEEADSHMFPSNRCGLYSGPGRSSGPPPISQ